MTASVPPVQPGAGRPSDAAHWARPVSKLKVSDVPVGAINLNVEGREVVGPLQGFGQMWQNTFRVRLKGVTVSPAEVIRAWKENIASFQPSDNHFYPSLAGVKPGEVVFIDTRLPVLPGLPGILPFASGVMVLYADDECFTVMTPEGFPEAGWNTFSAYVEDECAVAQVQSIVRANDPVYEIGLRFMGGARKQEQIWTYVLTALAAHFGVAGQVQVHKTCLDPQLQWSQAKNVWHNAGIRTTLYILAAPLRWVGKLFKR